MIQRFFQLVGFSVAPDQEGQESIIAVVRQAELSFTDAVSPFLTS